MGAFDNAASSVGNAIKGEVGNLVQDFKNATGQAHATHESPDAHSPLDTFTAFQNAKVQIGIADGFFDAANYTKFDSNDFSRLFSYYFEIYTVDKSGRKSTVQQFKFPMNPSAIEIGVTPASSMSVSMKGVIENHNGAPLRSISIRGSSGIAPNEPILEPQSAGSNSVIDTVFKNTFSQAVRVVNQANQVIQSAQSLFGEGTGTKAIINLDNATLKGKTGYDFIHAMMAFFDGYLAAKKSRTNANMRLAFVMAKDKLVYDVHLGPHRYRKAAGTLEYEYDISLVAYRRRPIDDNALTLAKADNPTTHPKDLNKLSETVNLLRKSRVLVADSLGVMAGIRSDIIESFLNPVREFILLGSDLVNAVTTMSDFPKSIVNAAQASIISTIKEKNGSATISALQDAMIQSGVYGDTTSDSSAQANGGGPVDGLLRRQGQTSKAASTILPADASPINDIFNNSEQYPGIFDTFQTQEMQFSDAVQAQINGELDRVRQITAADLVKRRDLVQSYASSISEGLGGGNATYNRIHGLNPPKVVYKDLSVDDIVLLSQLNDVIQGMDSFISSFNDGTTDQSNDYYKFYADFARSNSITFADSASKYYVPFPYGMSLEGLAAQYLGDSNRWIEIAAINGLQAPYIDEDGYTRALIGSGNGNQIAMADSSGLYIGQTISIGSSLKAPTARKVTSIKISSSIESIVTVDGEPNLAQYLFVDGAYMKAFAPNTVNSLNMIAIPSQAGVTVPATLKITPTPQDLDSITLVALVDILLQSNGDIVLSSTGDLSLATGVANMVQAAKIKLLTKLGSIVSDPSFGNPLNAGVSVGDISASQVLPILSQMFKDDPRFGQILAGSVAISGPAANVKMLVGIKGTGINLPLVADLPT